MAVAQVIDVIGAAVCGLLPPEDPQGAIQGDLVGFQFLGGKVDGDVFQQGVPCRIYGYYGSPCGHIPGLSGKAGGVEAELGDIV